MLTGAGLGVADHAAQGGLIAPVDLCLGGRALHVLAFGPDPLRDKGPDGVDTFQTTASPGSSIRQRITCAP